LRFNNSFPFMAMFVFIFIPFRIFCSGGSVSCIVFVSVYHGRFLFLL
jgi:hypothetical protein